MTDEIVIFGGAMEATLLPDAGARLHRLRAFGHDLLRSPDDPATHLADPFFWGGYVLAPWGNRVQAGPTRAAGREVDLAANFPDGSAIHGQVYDRPWRADDHHFTIDGGGDGWPWRYEANARASVSGSSLILEYSLRNLSDAPMPGGLGLHPWWRRPVEVAIPARSVYPTTTDSPARPEPVSGTFDRRRLGRMADGIDAAWTDLDEPAVELRWPESGIVLTMRATGPTIHVVGASPADVDAVAIEIQTHAPQGVRRLERGEPGGLELIDAGNALSLAIELTASGP
jgi:aldose 1-epimerase